MAGGGEDHIGGVAVAALEMATAEVSIRLHVTDHRLDGGAASEFAFDCAKHSALLTGDKDASWIFRRVATAALVDIGALDWATSELLSGFDVAERVTVIRIAW